MQELGDLPDGYNYKSVSNDENSWIFRVKEIKSKESAQEWLKKYEESSKTVWRVLRTYKSTGKNNIFKCCYRCQHNVPKLLKNIKISKHTRCPAQMKITVQSGGKDSCYNMMQCVADGHEIIALANLKPKKDEVDSYMYQSVGHNVLDLYATAMGLPLFRNSIEGKPLNQNFDYQPTEGDEVEDLYNLLLEVKNSVQIEAVSVGAIFSDYQRLRVENVCQRLNLKMLAYLWHRDQAELLKEMIDCKISAIIIKVAALGLDPKKHLGMTLEEIYPHMLNMNKKFGLNICGEGGEFETFTLDCPLFKKKLTVHENEHPLLQLVTIKQRNNLVASNFHIRKKFL